MTDQTGHQTEQNATRPGHRRCIWIAADLDDAMIDFLEGNTPRWAPRASTSAFISEAVAHYLEHLLAEDQLRQGA